MPNRTEADYLAAMKGALPQGPAFPRDGAPNRDGVLGAIAGEFAGEDAAAGRLPIEADPLSTAALLPEWERDYGLPDCPDFAPETYQGRIAALIEKYRRTGGWNPQKVKELCAALGYTVEIVEHRPFVGGISTGGQRIGGPHTCRHWIRIRVPGARATYFRGGQSTGGERQLSLTRAEDLECLLNLIKPAHQEVTVSYEGA